MNPIKTKIHSLLNKIPQHVTINAASKFRTAPEIGTAIAGGITDIGFNYVQEGIHLIKNIPQAAQAKFHLIGHLQSNKVKLAVTYFDSIDTVHSLAIAQKINKQAQQLNKKIEIMIQVKSPQEAHKNGVFLGEAETLVTSLAPLSHIYIKGLLAMGPPSDEPEALRLFFRQCKELYDRLKRIKQTNLKMEILSMGMSDSYLLAIEEGANQIRLGTSIYGPRPK